MHPIHHAMTVGAHGQEVPFIIGPTEGPRGHMMMFKARDIGAPA
jgi:hypothetical protein